ncbi:hypothetical protein Mycch_5861 (plasmid) [Mycolicibacterium chubuense NBB4]|uniref:Uncharacterized protein n=1 Tax=Mycolicibacterium chubuense (strain NBB4) TaxID=710421 RepID=I4BT68_MYCCN|nr:hypothetical protein Mycch_5861 [Mycolicibacterium chubuense NBB4]
MSTSLDQLPGIAESDCGTTVVMSYGMGVDSTVMVTLHCCRRGP